MEQGEGLFLLDKVERERYYGGGGVKEVLRRIKEAKTYADKVRVTESYLVETGWRVFALQNERINLSEWEVNLMVDKMGRSEVKEFWKRTFDRIDRETGYFDGFEIVELKKALKEGFYFDENQKRNRESKKVFWNRQEKTRLAGVYFDFGGEIYINALAPTEKDLIKSICVTGYLPRSLSVLYHEKIHAAQGVDLMIEDWALAVRDFIFGTKRSLRFDLATKAEGRGGEKEKSTKELIKVAQEEAEAYSAKDLVPSLKEGDVGDLFLTLGYGMAFSAARRDFELLRCLGVSEKDLLFLVKHEPMRAKIDRFGYVRLPVLEKEIEKRLKALGLKRSDTGWLREKLQEVVRNENKTQQIIAQEIAIEELKRESGEINWRSRLLRG